MSKNSISRIPELDGVRGLAVLLVLMVHIIPYNPVLGLICRFLNSSTPFRIWAGLVWIYFLSYLDF
jgi:peptidoglycan/LPS O-acetylase OafA/YrhL